MEREVFREHRLAVAGLAVHDAGLAVAEHALDQPVFDWTHFEVAEQRERGPVSSAVELVRPIMPRAHRIDAFRAQRVVDVRLHSPSTMIAMSR
jgi:hypothetical protein